MTTYLAQIDAALDRNDTPAAAALAEQALDAGQQDAILYNLAAWSHEEAGRFQEAEALLRAAIARYPKDPTLHLGLGVVQRKQGNLKASVVCFENAIRIDPRWPSPWYERGQSFEKGGAIADAGRDYEHALGLEPENAIALAALASIHARQGRSTEARQLAEHALRIDPGNLLAANALAQVALEEKHHDAAVALLEPLATRDEGPRDTMVNTLTLLGDALEGLGRFDEAYDAYARAQQVFHQFHSQRLADEAGSSIGFLARVAAGLTSARPREWSPADASSVEGAAATHVILTGYPRSGTTLAENILASLPGAVAIEERPTLGLTDQEYLSRDEGLADLAQADAPTLARLRTDYWQRATRAAGRDLQDALFVDMDPFKGPRLPAIARLFPGAKVIITRRDPRDVVWSCFHTSFAFNAGTMSFTTLEDTARHYAASWAVTEAALEQLPIDWFELRYESLVSEFDETTQGLCRFLGADWSEDLRSFDRTAQRRGVTTASATQVRRGLYDGSGGWRRYQTYLKGVEPILAPWIEKFGYA
ncbi:tetratricopeptide repeat-containing sulfotransferase family protein [Novosphingobium sp.]|uniref:tetratricopeptide repeat-containing sulfotransferase family protein n=1 Tax=Novosphingobium sp. TaxID=1874826 RepID=UPI0025E88AC5|nr:tetratricopeptide repeat-containing sulfotransferase family protein [Novosphingobium sp.]MCC6927227.1 sulfotransferase [Novosphingobium sp.]